MRPVMVSKNIWPEKATRPVKTEVGEALFHQFGYEYEEFESGAVPFSVAIVEFPDGTVETVQATFIRFLDVKEINHA